MWWTLLAGIALAQTPDIQGPVDIQGPTWARFGSDIKEAHAAGNHPGRMSNEAGRACFTDKRHMLEADWMVEVCAADGQHVDRVKVYTARDAEAAIAAANTRQDQLDAVSKRALGTLVGQYGQPTDDSGTAQVWLDPEGERLTLKQEVVTASRAGRYDAVVILYEKTPPDLPAEADVAPAANTGL